MPDAKKTYFFIYDPYNILKEWGLKTKEHYKERGDTSYEYDTVYYYYYYQYGYSTTTSTVAKRDINTNYNMVGVYLYLFQYHGTSCMVKLQSKQCTGIWRNISIERRTWPKNWIFSSKKRNISSTTHSLSWCLMMTPTNVSILL